MTDRFPIIKPSPEMTIVNGDCLPVLRANCQPFAGLVFTSPPYNVGIDYDVYVDQRPFDEYLDWLELVFGYCFETLLPGGHLLIQVGNVNRNPYVPVKDHLAVRLSKFLPLKGEIIWKKSVTQGGGSTAWGSWLSPNRPSLRDLHEYILVFRKDGDRKGQSDLERDEFLAWTQSVWEIAPESKGVGGHPAPFPVALAHRAVKLYSYPGEIVLDPFAGSGTTLLAAQRLRRGGFGVDLSPAYCRITADRLAQFSMDALEGTCLA